MYYSIHNISETLKNDLCVGCGICKTACPHDAIDIHLNSQKEYRPVVSEDKCKDCDICRQACPMDLKNLSKRINNALSLEENYGIKNNDLFFQGFTNNAQEYISSSSGGILTTVLKELLNSGEVDAIIHAEASYGDKEHLYFKASISKNSDELDSKRSSFYYPIEFSSILDSIRINKEINSVAVVGVPCALSGMSYLKPLSKKLGDKIKYRLSLACSHNVSGQFAERLVKDFHPEEEALRLNFRDKEGIEKAEDFNNSITTKKGEKTKKSRFKSPYTVDWRNYTYAFKACLYCPDFWGESSDASFKDAWGVITQRKEGETLFHIKNPKLNVVVEKLVSEGKITIQSIEKERFINSQGNTIRYKTADIAERVKKHKTLVKEFKDLPQHPGKLFKRLDYQIKSNTIKNSKQLWEKKNKTISTRKLRLKGFILRKTDGIITLLNSNKRLERKEKEILFTAGFGYGNIGDEAMLRTNLNIWKYYKDYKITLLSPNPNQTKDLHGNYEIILASRISFWGIKGLEYFGIGNRKSFWFIFMLCFTFIRFNSFLLKHFGFTIFLHPNASYLLKKIQKATALQIGGGGFLMGKTSPRLLDFMALIHIANYFKTDVILSGQNIGSFNHWYQRRIAKKVRFAKFVGLRDKQESLRDLKKLGVYNEDKVIPMFDDALFCDELRKNDYYSILGNYGIKKNDKYITVHVHYWKVNKDKVNKVLDELAEKLDSLISMGYKVLLIPMDPSDRSALYRLRNVMTEKPPIFMYNMNVPLLVSAFRNAHITITMKHHPIIFSMSGKVPVLSIAFEEYYNHKNIGALELFGQEENALAFDETFSASFDNKIEALLRNRETIRKEIGFVLEEFKLKKGLIIKKYTEYKNSYLKTT